MFSKTMKLEVLRNMGSLVEMYRAECRYRGAWRLRGAAGKVGDSAIHCIFSLELQYLDKTFFNFVTFLKIVPFFLGPLRGAP